MSYRILNRLNTVINVLAMPSAVEKKKWPWKLNSDQTNFPNLKQNPNSRDKRETSPTDLVLCMD